MKTTVEIDDALFRQAKVYAATHGHSLRSLLEDGLRERLARRLGGRDCEHELGSRLAVIRKVVADVQSDPVLDDSSVAELLLWDESGLPR